MGDLSHTAAPFIGLDALGKPFGMQILTWNEHRFALERPTRMRNEIFKGVFSLSFGLVLLLEKRN